MATKQRKSRAALGYLVATRENGLTRWAKSDRPVVPWTLYTSSTRPTIFPDLHAARVAIREAAKYWATFSTKRNRTTPKQERERFYIIRAETPYAED